MQEYSHTWPRQFRGIHKSRSDVNDVQTILLIETLVVGNVRKLVRKIDDNLTRGLWPRGAHSSGALIHVNQDMDLCLRVQVCSNRSFLSLHTATFVSVVSLFFPLNCSLGDFFLGGEGLEWIGKKRRHREKNRYGNKPLICLRLRTGYR